MSSQANLLWQTVAPVFMLMGTLGNVLSIIVLTRPGNRKSSTALYLTALAFSDLIVIYTGLMRWWVIHLFEIDVRLLGNIGCKIHWFLIFASTEHSSWLLVAVTSERIISTIWPHRVKVICTPKSAKVTISLITLCIYGGSVHLLYGMGLRSVGIDEGVKGQTPLSANILRTTTFVPLNNTISIKNNNPLSEAPEMSKLVCGAFNGEFYQKFFDYVYPWMDLLLYFFIPAVILLIGEILIIQKIISSRRLHMRMMSVNVGEKTKFSDKSTSITIMLLTVNAVFIMCTTPVSVYLIGMPYWVDQTLGFTQTQEIAWAIVNLLMYLNHSINFILYFLSGARFRKKVFDLFKRKHSAKAASSLSSHREDEDAQAHIHDIPAPSIVEGNYYKQCDNDGPYCVSRKSIQNKIPTIPETGRLNGKTVELGILHVNDLIAGTSNADDTHERLNNNTVKMGMEKRINKIKLVEVNEDSGFFKSDETNDPNSPHGQVNHGFDVTQYVDIITHL